MNYVTRHMAVSHELKNRLSGLQGHLAELLPLVPESAHDGLRHALRMSASASLTAHALVVLGKDEEHVGANPRYEYLPDVMGVIAEDADLFVPPGIALEMPADVEEVDVFLDLDLVRLALNAALDNAGKAAKRRICLRVNATKHGILFEVSNDMRGATLEVGRDYSTYGSTGLGLKVIQAVACAHRVRGKPGYSRLSLVDGQAVLGLWLPQ